MILSIYDKRPVQFSSAFPNKGLFHEQLPSPLIEGYLFLIVVFITEQ